MLRKFQSDGLWWVSSLDGSLVQRSIRSKFERSRKEMDPCIKRDNVEQGHHERLNMCPTVYLSLFYFCSRR